MSQDYAESNDESSRELFEKRNSFRVRQDRMGSPLEDFNFGEKYFYGRVSRRFVPIVIRSDVLRDFNASLVEGGRMSDINFVVRAFNALGQQFKKCAMQQKIAPNEPYLTTLRIYKAIESHDVLYSAHVRKNFNALRTEFLNQDIKVKNFEDFVSHFLRIFKNKFSGTAFTKTAYMKSAECPVGASGLTVEIADIDPTNDVAKIEFMNSPNWEFFVNACRSYGFMIDANIPYRMVADIGSAAMMEYAVQDGFNSTDAVLNNAYQYAHEEYFPQFRYYLLQLYKEIRAESFLDISYCAETQTTVTETIHPTKYSKDSFGAKFMETYFVHLYIKIRLLESSNTGLTDFELETLKDDCIEIYDSAGLAQCLEIFEIIINKPFDYPGSLSYTYARIKSVLEDQANRKDKSSPRTARNAGSAGGVY